MGDNSATEEEAAERLNERVPTGKKECQDTNAHLPQSPDTTIDEKDRQRHEERERRRERDRAEKERRRTGSELTAGEEGKIEPLPQRIFHGGAWYVLDRKSL